MLVKQIYYNNNHYVIKIFQTWNNYNKDKMDHKNKISKESCIYEYFSVNETYFMLLISENESLGVRE